MIISNNYDSLAHTDPRLKLRLSSYNMISSTRFQIAYQHYLVELLKFTKITLGTALYTLFIKRGQIYGYF